MERHLYILFIKPLLQMLMSVEDCLVRVSEALCYCGLVLSAVIAWRLARVENLSFFNRMFVGYFGLDFIIGGLETYFLFKLYRER